MFSVGYIQNAVVVSALNQRRIDRLNIAHFKSTIQNQLRNSIDKVIIDLNGVKFIDSHSFRVIEKLFKNAESASRTLEFANADEEVLELFELIPETKKYKVHKNVEATKILDELVVV